MPRIGLKRFTGSTRRYGKGEIIHYPFSIGGAFNATYKLRARCNTLNKIEVDEADSTSIEFLEWEVISAPKSYNVSASDPSLNSYNLMPGDRLIVDGVVYVNDNIVPTTYANLSNKVAQTKLPPHSVWLSVEEGTHNFEIDVKSSHIDEDFFNVIDPSASFAMKLYIAKIPNNTTVYIKVNFTENLESTFDNTDQVSSTGQVYFSSYTDIIDIKRTGVTEGNVSWGMSSLPKLSSNFFYIRIFRPRVGSKIYITLLDDNRNI